VIGDGERKACFSATRSSRKNVQLARQHRPKDPVEALESRGDTLRAFTE